MPFQKAKEIFSDELVQELWIDRIGNRKICKMLFENLKIKKERKRSLDSVFVLETPMNRAKKRFSGKVSFCTFFSAWKKASLSVETAMVLPIFFLGMVAMISFMDIYKLQTEHLMKLCEKTKEAGMYAYVLDGAGTEEIILPDLYTYHPVGGVIPLGDVVMHNTIKVHAWTGKTYEGQAEGQETSEEAEEMVYVTEHGSVYHKSMGCSYLDLSVTSALGASVASMRNNYGERYQPCEACSRNQSPGGVVYITGKGNRYHNLETCSGLKRTVRMVKHSQVEGHMAACSRCG